MGRGPAEPAPGLRCCGSSCRLQIARSVCTVRNIEIGCQDGETHPYVAIDQSTNQVMFRHDDLSQLIIRSLCQKLRWRAHRSHRLACRVRQVTWRGTAAIWGSMYAVACRLAGNPLPELHVEQSIAADWNSLPVATRAVQKPRGRISECPAVMSFNHATAVRNNRSFAIFAWAVQLALSKAAATELCDNRVTSFLAALWLAIALAP